jgi:hypothetical protein
MAVHSETIAKTLDGRYPPMISFFSISMMPSKLAYTA